MAEKYNNATTLYDNVVTESEGGRGGITSKLKDTLSSSVNNISQNPKIQQLSKLKSGTKSLTSSNYKEMIGAKVKGTLNAFADSAKSMAKSMVQDSLTTLKNAGKNFVKNTVNQLIEDIKASVYIPDKVFCATIKGMYYAGADLAYMDHYIRNKALVNDWSETLEFLDKQYGIKYTLEYDKLDQDITKAAKGGAFKNIEYMFKQLLDERNSVNNQLYSINSSLTSGGLDNNTITSLTRTSSTLNNNVKKYDKKLVQYTKMIITYGYSSLKASEVKKIIKMTNGIVLPRYFGTTDNKYNKSYNFTDSDCKIMMPTWKPNDKDTTEADKDTLMDIGEQTLAKKKTTDSLKDSAKRDLLASEAAENNEYSTDSRYKGSYLEAQYTKTATEYKVQSKLKTFQANYESKNASRTSALSTTAIKKGSKAVISDTRARYHKNKDGVQVKYRKSATSYIESALEGEDTFITLRNNNIKSIYILLTNTSIYGNDVMVNENFYKRCKLPSAKGLKRNADKARGLLGASSAVQTIYDIQDFVDSSAYNYTKKVEENLYNPQRKQSLLTGQVSSLDISAEGKLILPIINDAGTVTNTENIEEAIKHPESFQPSNQGTTVSNNTNKDDIDNKLDNNIKAKQQVLSSTRYISKLQPYVKRDILIKYLSWFYNTIIDYDISEDIAKNCLSTLVYNIFGRTGFDNPNKLDDLFINSDNESLSNNITMYVSVSKLKLHKDYIGLSNYDNVTIDNITKIYDISVYIMEIELKSTSFAKSVFNYDNDYIKTLVKQKYEADLTHLKSLHSTNTMPDFWIQKDVMTKNYDGFDRFGIFGFDERTNFRVKYTNVEIGDWNSICVGTEGTFFGGSDNTSNNGVRYLDESSDTIYPTSITSGTWKIFERCSTMLFLNDKNELYTWNSNRNDLDKILDNADKYDTIDFPKYNLIFLLGKSNNGVLLLDNKSISTIIDSGDHFKYVINKNKLFFFSESSFVNAIAFDLNDKTFNSIGISKPVTTPIFFTIKKTITATSPSTGQEQQSGSSQQQTTTTVEYVHHILFGTQDNNGIVDIINNSTSDSRYTSNTYERYEKSTVSTGNYHLFKTSDTEVYAICDSSESGIGSKFDLKLEQDYAITTGQPVVYTPDYTTSSYNIHYNATNFSYINDYLFFTSANSNQNIATRKFYVHNPEDNQLYTINPEDIWTIKFSNIYWRDSSLIIGIDSLNRVYGYNYKTHTLNIIHEFDSSYDKYGDYWEYGYVNNKYGYLYNKYIPKGLFIYDNLENKKVENNLTTGYWKLIQGRNYYYALSQNGTNLGVKKSPLAYFNFTNITEQIVDHYDINGFAYDSSKYRTYCGTERSKDTFPINSINYDIDEYVYLKNSYQLYKIIENSNSGQTTGMMNEITNKIKKAKENGENIDLTSLSNELSNKYDSYKESIDDLITESPLYTDLVSTVMANEEFDVDDKSMKIDIVTDLIMGDEGKNSKNYMLIDDEANTKFVVRNYDSKYKTLVPGTRNYNLINDYATSDFLNSDENDVTGVPISN